MLRLRAELACCPDEAAELDALPLPSLLSSTCAALKAYWGFSGCSTLLGVAAPAFVLQSHGP